jgi:hypothetical protein
MGSGTTNETRKGMNPYQQEVRVRTEARRDLRVTHTEEAVDRSEILCMNETPEDLRQWLTLKGFTFLRRSTIFQETWASDQLTASIMLRGDVTKINIWPSK